MKPKNGNCATTELANNRDISGMASLARATSVYRRRSTSLSALVPALCGDPTALSLLGFRSPGYQLHVVALQSTDSQPLEGTRHKSITSDSI
jgi:hypothetical protein